MQQQKVLTMELVYRVQTKTGEGPYRGINKEGFLIISNFSPLRDASERHPGPHEEWGLVMEDLRERHIFGFLTIESLKNWFHLPEFDHIWEDCGIATYRAPVIYRSPRQCVFDKRKSQLLTFQSASAILG